MTRIALDETKKCKKTSYMKADIISLIISVHILFQQYMEHNHKLLLVLFLIALYFSDYLFVNVVRLNYLQLGIMIGGGYFILLTGTIFLLFLLFETIYSQPGSGPVLSGAYRGTGSILSAKMKTGRKMGMIHLLVLREHLKTFIRNIPGF